MPSPRSTTWEVQGTVSGTLWYLLYKFATKVAAKDWIQKNGCTGYKYRIVKIVRSIDSVIVKKPKSRTKAKKK